MLELVDGNLLEAQTEALVNAVNTEGVMGKGIALQSKRKCPEMVESYRRACRACEVQPGRMHVFDVGGASQPRYIINFPTKRRWRSVSRLEDIDTGLTALVHEVRRLETQSIAVPALGCGNGGLDWSDIFPRIKGVLGMLQEVKVLVYQPRGPAVGRCDITPTGSACLSPSISVLRGLFKKCLPVRSPAFRRKGAPLLRLKPGLQTKWTTPF